MGESLKFQLPTPNHRGHNQPWWGLEYHDGPLKQTWRCPMERATRTSCKSERNHPGGLCRRDHISTHHLDNITLHLTWSTKVNNLLVAQLLKHPLLMRCVGGTNFFRLSMTYCRSVVIYNLPQRIQAAIY